MISSEEIITIADVTKSYKFGHSLIFNLWDKLKLDKLFQNNIGKRDRNTVIDAVSYLMAHRCSDPKSILDSFEDIDSYAGIKNLKIDSYYDALDVLDKKVLVIRKL